MSESNIQASPGSIFICYRREDSADVTGRLYDRLVDHFGLERVFMDVEAIRLGYDFRSEIDQTIKVCSIVIVVIGDQWLAQVDGRRRIDDENDRVRIEIEAALRREIPIIPVLTRGASHPTKAMLPASLEALAYRHGTSIRHEHFRGDVDSLISQMEKKLELATPTTPVLGRRRLGEATMKRALIATATTAAVILVALLSLLISRRQPLVQQQPKLNQETQQPSTSSSAQEDYDSAMEFLNGMNKVQMDRAKAIELLQRAATQHVPEAEARLALFTRSGAYGVPKDGGKAEELAQQSLSDGLAAMADTNRATAGEALAHLYEEGLGVGKNLPKAAELFQKAAELGNASAQTNLGALYESGAGVEKNPTKAAEFYQKGANQGYSNAQIRLASLYQRGVGVTKDAVQAAGWYKKAADQGNPQGQFSLGQLYENGTGVEKDFKKAAIQYQKAADQGLARAQERLGWFYANGLGVTYNVEKAAELYQKAADQDDPAAQNNLGVAYANGRGVSKDLTKAAELYQKAATHGNQVAQANLAALYEKGSGVGKDASKAIELYRKAADQGNEEAKAGLRRLTQSAPSSSEQLAAAATPSASAVTPQPTTSGAEGAIWVSTTPAGAIAILDGSTTMTTPATFSHVPYGSHNLQIVREGYFSQERQIYLNSMVSMTGMITLQPQYDGVWLGQSSGSWESTLKIDSGTATIVVQLVNRLRPGSDHWNDIPAPYNRSPTWTYRWSASSSSIRTTETSISINWSEWKSSWEPSGIPYSVVTKLFHQPPNRNWTYTLKGSELVAGSWTFHRK